MDSILMVLVLVRDQAVVGNVPTYVSKSLEQMAHIYGPSERIKDAFCFANENSAFFVLLTGEAHANNTVYESATFVSKEER
jgi:hypothetical protein